MTQNKVKSPQKTPRKRVPPRRIEYVNVDKPSAHCPRCRKFVPDEGVVCSGCNAFWHYTCANVTHEEIEREWGAKEYLCNTHRSKAVEAEDNILGKTKQTDEVSIRIRINSYTLNPQSTVNKMLTSLNLQSKIEPRDQNQQYYVKLCLPTFQILVANLIDFGQQWGITIKNGRVNNKGTTVGTNFTMQLCTNSGNVVETSVDCYSTQSSLHIQLNKGTKNLAGWEEKVECLSQFIYHILDNVIQKIESTTDFKHLKEDMRSYLTSIKGLDKESLSTLLSSSRLLATSYGTHTMVSQHSTPSTPTELPMSEPILPSMVNTSSTAPCDDDTSEIPPKSVAETLPGDLQSDRQEAQLLDGMVENAASSHVEVVEDSADNSRHESTIGQLQDALQSLRLTLKDHKEEITKLRSENTLKKLQKELEEKTKQTEEKDEKIFKVMAIKEQLGNTIQSLKEKLEAAEKEVSFQNEKMVKQEETIRQQTKAMNELNLRSECNKEVATLFMDEVLEDDDEHPENEPLEKAYQEQIAKLFKELTDERKKIDQYDREKRT